MGKWRTLLTVAGMLLLGAAVSAQSGYKVIVNSSNPIASVSKAQVARFFLENAIWDDGRPASAVDLPPASPFASSFPGTCSACRSRPSSHSGARSPVPDAAMRHRRWRPIARCLHTSG